MLNVKGDLNIIIFKLLSSQFTEAGLFLYFLFSPSLTFFSFNLLTPYTVRTVFVWVVAVIPCPNVNEE